MGKYPKIFISTGIIVLGVIMAASLFKSSHSNELRVAFPAGKSALSYEPTKIHLGHEYIFLENVFSPLVEINPRDGQITAGLAKSYEWQNNDLVLEIRDDSKTISGKPITAEDVEFSLKRLLVLSGNTHGNFKDLVCPNATLKSIEEPCEGIAQSGNKVILKAGKRKSFLVPMLAAIDFAIIPKTSVDPKTLAIINYKETSGPYFVDHDDDQGKIVLKANPNHYRFTQAIPQIIKLVPVNPSEKSASLALFEKGEVDHLTTIDQSKSEDIFAYAQGKSDVVIHSTHKIRNLSLVFTEKGLKELTNSERHQIGNQIRKAFVKLLEGKPTHEKTDEFFSSLADGGLSPEEKVKINLAYANLSPANLSKQIRIGIIRSGDIAQWREEIQKVIPTSEVYQENNVPDFKKYDSESERPHAFIASTDTGFSEDINLISYTLAAGFFGLTKDERQKWLAEYMENDSKAERLSKLRAIHFKALNEATLVPISVAPFVAITKKPWKMELSELYANNPLWLIKQ